MDARESGIYEHWVREILHFYGRQTKLIASVYQREQNILCEYNAIRMNGLSDLFYLLCFCLFIAIIILLLEYSLQTICNWFKVLYIIIIFEYSLQTIHECIKVLYIKKVLFIKTRK